MWIVKMSDYIPCGISIIDLYEVSQHAYPYGSAIYQMPKTPSPNHHLSVSNKPSLYVYEWKIIEFSFQNYSNF